MSCACTSVLGVCCVGSDNVRFKAEVNFDGREVARKHVNKLDLEALLMVIITSCENVL